MSLEYWVPFGHSGDLVLVVSLTGASWEVSFSPLGETSCQLSGTNWWICTVVSVKFGITSLSVIGWSTMWELCFVIESTSLVTSVEVSCHTFSVCSEFVDPCVLRWEPREPVGHKFFSKFNQSVQSLKGVTWWDLLFTLSGSNGNNDSWWDFHLVVFLLLSSIWC